MTRFISAMSADLASKPMPTASGSPTYPSSTATSSANPPKGAKTSPVEGWDKYLAAGIALFEVVEDDLLPIRPIGIQV